MGGGRGAAPSQLSLLSPEGMSADFLKSDPGRPPALPPLTWTRSLGNHGRGEWAHLGGRGQVLLPLQPPQPRGAERGATAAIKPSRSSRETWASGPAPPASVSPSAGLACTSFFPLETTPCIPDARPPPILPSFAALVSWTDTPGHPEPQFPLLHLGECCQHLLTDLRQENA